MRMFVWQNVNNVTTSWHNGGGVMVVARDIKRARELIAEQLPYHGGEPTDSSYEGADCTALTNEPDFVYHIEDANSQDIPEERVVVFPNAGCC